MKKTVGAFFDFDKTLLTVESARPGIRYMYERGLISMGFILRVLTVNFFYQRHLIPEERMSRLLLTLYRGRRLRDFEESALSFYREEIKPLLAPGILKRVREHQERGHVLVLISASVRYYLQHVASDLGFDHLICTDLEIDERGLLTGRAQGAICLDEQKRRQAEELAGQVGIDLEASYAYGNHQSDLPLLERVGNPAVVEPTLPLKKIAAKRSWPILGFE